MAGDWGNGDNGVDFMVYVLKIETGSVLKVIPLLFGHGCTCSRLGTNLAPARAGIRYLAAQAVVAYGLPNEISFPFGDVHLILGLFILVGQNKEGRLDCARSANCMDLGNKNRIPCLEGPGL